MADPQEERARQHFEKLIADHEMHIFHEDGLYRQVRYHAPDTRTYWFDLVTWPGYLAINGDLVSGFTFSRENDMFSFFWDHYGSDDPFYINPQYWEEKITCPYTKVRKYGEYDAEAGEAPWEWEPSFLLSCHAIRWGIAKYREQEA